MGRRKTTTTRTDDCCFRFGRKLGPFHLRVTGYRRLNRIGEQKIIEFLCRVKFATADLLDARLISNGEQFRLLVEFLAGRSCDISIRIASRAAKVSWWEKSHRIALRSPMQHSLENSSPATIFMDEPQVCGFYHTKRCGYNVSISQRESQARAFRQGWLSFGLR